MRNAGLRVIALLLAVGLWVFVNAGQHEAETALHVPIEYRGLPVGLMIVNDHPDFVNLEISGPRTLLSLLDPGRLALRLDLHGVTPGEADFKIGPELFQIPRQTAIERISPAEIRLEVDQIVTREVPVHASLSGTPVSGYKVMSVEVLPQVVAITGPRKHLGQLERVDTEPLDLSGVSGEVTRQLQLVNPGKLFKVSADRVVATVSLQEILTYREFRGVQVQVKDASYGFRIEPDKVNVMVKGPVRELERLNLAGLVFVDAHGVPPGVHELPVRVDLPDGLALVHPTPEKVRVRMFFRKAS